MAVLVPTVPTHWKKLAPACWGPGQSPINTDLHRVRWISTLGPFIFRGDDSAPLGPWTPENDSHTGLLQMDTDPQNHLEIQGPGLLLPAYFTLLLHFHCGGLSAWRPWLLTEILKGKDPACSHPGGMGVLAVPLEADPALIPTQGPKA
ncbi:carbonic anhydrase 15-like [Sapajus apella]|uniref:Carbonic anhydrase 15-like n=1 Tax=Sapajus apella TaxID=9515 RepID=A0A6J3HB87_SAPAP|nr:carbonic anhydrase 15-like [Sapajus apella]